MMDLAQLKICFLAGTLEHGGAERQLFYMLQALRARGAAPQVLCLDEGQVWEGPIQRLGVPVTCVGQSGSRLQRLGRILREVRALRPDILQCAHFFTNAYGSAAEWLLGVPAIGAMRSNGVLDVRSCGRLFGWLSLRACSMLAANSAAAIAFARAQGMPAQKLFLLPNVVDTEQWLPGAAASSASRPVTLVAVGRLVALKRLDLFIEALARLRQRLGLEVRGLIVGEGPMRETWAAHAAALGLGPETLRFAGALTDLASVYQQADVCVLTSELEGTPNVLLEAMACGLPVVATDVGGVPDIVREGLTGCLVPSGQIEPLTQALARLVTDHPLRQQMGRQARDYIEATHSLHRLPDFLQELYGRVLSAGKGPAVRLRPDLLKEAV